MAKKILSKHEAKLIASEIAANKKTPADLMLKAIIFLERNSTWTRRKRRTEAGHDSAGIDELVKKIEQAQRGNGGKLQ